MYSSINSKFATALQDNPRLTTSQTHESRVVDLHFVLKMGSVMTHIWSFRLHCESLTFMAEYIDSTATKTIQYLERRSPVTVFNKHFVS